jgi:hypothetical protein
MVDAWVCYWRIASRRWSNQTERGKSEVWALYLRAGFGDCEMAKLMLGYVIKTQYFFKYKTRISLYKFLLEKMYNFA